jgi:uncharacterized protein YpuA (DUF1002 family)
MEKMDTSELLERVNEAKETIKTAAEAKTKAVGFIAKVKEIITSIGNFFQNIIDALK